MKHIYIYIYKLHPKHGIYIIITVQTHNIILLEHLMTVN